MVLRTIIIIIFMSFIGIWPAESGQDHEINRLKSLPYLQGYHEASDLSGVTIYNKKSAYKGLNLYCQGDRVEAGLMDMRGNILHMWHYDADDIWMEDRGRNDGLWRRVHLYENGDLLAVWEQLGVVKLDKDSNVLWVYSCRAHHDLTVASNGDIYFLARKMRSGEELGRTRQSWDDYITVLNADGEFLREYSIFNLFQRSSYAFILKQEQDGSDIFHTNTIQLMNGDLEAVSPIFKKGNVLVAMRHLDTIAIIDLEKEQVVWAKDGKEGGLWRMMHEPVLLPSGRILLFDNLGGDGKYGCSRVLEYDIFKDKIVWKYEGDQKHFFESESCGINERLPNGNTLITDFEHGRAFEVTSKGKMVWEYYNPYRTGEDNKLVATLYQMERLDKNDVKWLMQ